MQLSIVLIELCDVIGFVEKWNLYFVVNNYILSIMTRILVSVPGPKGPIVSSYNLQFNFSHFFQDVNLAIFRPSEQFILFCECSHFNRTRLYIYIYIYM